MKTQVPISLGLHRSCYVPSLLLLPPVQRLLQCSFPSVTSFPMASSVFPPPLLPLIKWHFFIAVPITQTKHKSTHYSFFWGSPVSHTLHNTFAMSLSSNSPCLSRISTAVHTVGEDMVMFYPLCVYGKISFKCGLITLHNILSVSIV